LAHPGGRDHAAPLVPEAQVFRLVGQGASNTEIAQGLYVGETTVKTHISRIQTKLAARDRVQLVVMAHQAGLTA
jgi:DNA-binding NarL/FixJ family response regulator